VTAPDDQLVVLASGGVDSAILAADQAAHGQVVHPLYIRFGLAWEEVEEAHLRRFLDAISDQGNLRPLTVLELPIADVYGAHWSVSGSGTPDDTTPDEAVYLPGRNLLLLAKTTVWCALHGVEKIALGTLRGNPFADSSYEFLSGLAGLASLALDHRLEVLTPFATRSKAEVLRLGGHLPLEHTFSCVAPVQGVHCQACNKCAERRKAFAEAGIEDKTSYAPR
jgi:7-cyano-7-deazaguanine synthase